MKTAFAWIVVVLIATWAIGFGVSTLKGMPPEAKLYIDTRHNSYLSPPCLQKGHFDDAYTAKLADFVPTRLADVRARQKAMEPLRPDTTCKNDGDGFFVSQALLPSLLGMSKNRWTKDGDWNW